MVYRTYPCAAINLCVDYVLQLPGFPAYSNAGFTTLYTVFLLPLLPNHEEFSLPFLPCVFSCMKLHLLVLPRVFNRDDLYLLLLPTVLAYKCSDRWGGRRGKPALGGSKGGGSWLGAS